MHRFKERKLKVLNLTPHPIDFIDMESSRFSNVKPKVICSIPPLGIVARVKFKTEIVENVKIGQSSIPVVQLDVEEIMNLPEPQPNTIYIVSKAVFDAAPQRDDLYTLVGLRRDRNGKVLGGSFLSRGIKS